MRGRVEITDEMVERAAEAYRHASSASTTMNVARKMLDAALNSPPEPEILVTEEMHSAGVQAYWQAIQMGNQPKDAVANQYRAMRALEPKPKCIEDHPNMEERLRGSK